MANWQILGVGAIGSLWACYLHKAGHRVELLFRNSEALERYRTRGGLTLIRDGMEEQLCMDAGVAAGPGTPAELLLITTKAHQTVDALAQFTTRLGNRSRLLLLQNGMGVAEQIVEHYPATPLFCAVTTDGAWCPESFTVVHAGTGATAVGAFRNPADPRTVTAHLPAKFLTIEACSDIEARQWQKLAINCAVNGLTAVYQCRNGALLEQSEAHARMAKLCEEIKQVGTALGYGDWAADLLEKTEAVIRATAANYNSMCQDIEHHRLTEIDYLNGYLLKQAQRLGIACLENEKLYEEIKRMERDPGCN